MHTIATISVTILTIVYIYLYISLAYKASILLKPYHKYYYNMLTCYILLGTISGIVWIWSHHRIHEGVYKIVEILQFSMMALLHGVGLR